MNLFILDNDPIISSQYNVDSHVRKIILESAQMLCYAFPENSTPIKNSKKGFYFHPMSKWVRESQKNWEWTLYHLFGLLDEFEYRFGKKHAFIQLFRWMSDNQIELNFSKEEKTQFPQCFGQFKNQCFVESNPVLGYQNYYNVAKGHLFKWTKREIPYFIDKSKLFDNAPNNL